MAKNFFERKKSWSTVKDNLLSCYLTPYFAKILQTRKSLVYVDCFAGKGKFDDGADGSPLIALKIFQDKLQKSGVQKDNQFIEADFIELKYFEALQQNLAQYSSIPNLKVAVHAGNYEEQIHKILQGKSGFNLFLYIDPFGIKELDLQFLGSLSGKNFYTTEFLLNFNSFGFLRMACKFLKFDFPAKLASEDAAEFDSSEEMLNRVAGGGYWQNMIRTFYKDDKDFHALEENFTREYCNRLRKFYSYVLNIPISVKEGNTPKYRMIFATNHPDGAVLMVGNIFKRMAELRKMEFGGQQSLFVLDCAEKNTAALITNHLKKFPAPARLNLIMAEYFTEYGVNCSLSDFRQVLKNLESTGAIEVIRKPEVTSTGKRATFFSESGRQTVEVKWKS